MNLRMIIVVLLLLNVPNTFLKPMDPIVVEELHYNGIIPVNATDLNLSMVNAYVSFELGFSMSTFEMEIYANYTFDSSEERQVTLAFPITLYEPFSVEIRGNGIQLKYKISTADNFTDNNLKEDLKDYTIILTNMTFRRGKNLIEIEIKSSNTLNYGGYSVEYPLFTAKYWNTSNLQETIKIISNKNASKLYPSPNISKVANSEFIYEWSFTGKPGVDKVAAFFATKEYLEQREMIKTITLFAIIGIVLSISVLVIWYKKRKGVKSNV